MSEKTKVVTISSKLMDLHEFTNCNELYKYVALDIIEDSKDYEGVAEANILARLDDISHGLSSGVVNGLIYYSETTAFYQSFKVEISQLLYALLDDAGLSIAELFGDKWDEKDPLALEDTNQNLLAWFAYEEVAEKLRNFLTQD